jgi:hypothetical protein
MRKLFCIFGLTMLVMFGVVQAQPYKLAVGARVGNYLGLSVKGNFTENHSLEVIAETRRKGYLATLLYEFHLEIRKAEGLRPYIGAGFHFGSFSSTWINSPNPSRSFGAGLDAIIGLEYTFDGAPINISIDIKPFFNYTGVWNPYFDNYGLGLRYTFK